MCFFRSRFVMFLLLCRATFICDPRTAQQATLHARDLFSSTQNGYEWPASEPADHPRFNQEQCTPGTHPELRWRCRNSVYCIETGPEWRDRVAWVEDNVCVNMPVNITSRTAFALTAGRPCQCP